MKRSTLEQFLRWKRPDEEPPSTRCPDETELAAFAEARLSSDRSSRMRSHLASCERCRADVAFLIRTAAPGTLEGASRSPALWRLPWVAALAATLVVAWIWQAGGKGPGPKGERTSGQQRTVEESAQELRFVGLEEEALLSRRGLAFEWSDLKGASIYEIRILTLDGGLAWSEMVSESTARVPEAVDLPPGTYYVRVEAPLPGGRRLASPHRKFSIVE